MRLLKVLLGAAVLIATIGLPHSESLAQRGWQYQQQQRQLDLQRQRQLELQRQQRQRQLELQRQRQLELQRQQQALRARQQQIMREQQLRLQKQMKDRQLEAQARQKQLQKQQAVQRTDKLLTERKRLIARDREKKLKLLRDRQLAKQLKDKSLTAERDRASLTLNALIAQRLATTAKIGTLGVGALSALDQRKAMRPDSAKLSASFASMQELRRNAQALSLKLRQTRERLALAPKAKVASAAAVKKAPFQNCNGTHCQTCSFHGDTLVLTVEGLRPIRDVKAGKDFVWARDERTGRSGWRPVLAHYANIYNETLQITVRDPNTGLTQAIFSNRIHPFFVRDKRVPLPFRLTMATGGGLPTLPDGALRMGRWVEAQHLSPGDQLLTVDALDAEVAAVTAFPRPLEAFNLTVGDVYTYFVAADAVAKPVWVHNECPPRLPTDDSQLKHIFRHAPGHLLDTRRNRERLIQLAADRRYYVGRGRNDLEWYTRILPSGRQLWVVVRHGIIQNGGLNDEPIDHKTKEKLE